MSESNRSLDYRDPDWLAEQLGVDKTTIYRYLQDGTLPGLQLGRKWLVSERQLVQFLEDETRRQTEQRRKGLNRFDQFTERARRVLTTAQEEATALNHNYIGTEHILLGLLRDSDGLAARALTAFGVNADEMRSTLVQTIGRGPTQVSGEIGLTPRSKKAIEFAIEEGRRMNHSYVGTEHILLGLLREGDGVAARMLGAKGVSLDQARSEVLKLLMKSEPPSEGTQGE